MVVMKLEYISTILAGIKTGIHQYMAFKIVFMCCGNKQPCQ